MILHPGYYHCVAYTAKDKTTNLIIKHDIKWPINDVIMVINEGIMVNSDTMDLPGNHCDDVTCVTSL